MEVIPCSRYVLRAGIDKRINNFSIKLELFFSFLSTFTFLHCARVVKWAKYQSGQIKISDGRNVTKFLLLNYQEENFP